MADVQNQNEQDSNEWIEELRSGAKKSGSKKTKLKIFIIIGGVILAAAIGFGLFAIFSNMSGFYKITQGTNLSTDVKSMAYKEGEEVTLTAEYEIDGYRFVYWEVDGEKGSSDREIKFTIDASTPKKYVAVYELLYGITIDDALDAGIITTNLQTAVHGEVVEGTITEPRHTIITRFWYTTENITYEIPQNDDGTFSFTMPNESIVIHADLYKTAFDIILPEIQTGYEIYSYYEDELFDMTEVDRGVQSVPFRIKVDDAYINSVQNLVLRVNGTILSPVGTDGNFITYEIRNIDDNIEITIDGLNINKYLITYLDDNQQIITVQEFNYGEIPEFPGIPVKQPTNYYTYTFTGWDREFEAVTEDAVYTASFDSVIREYTVTIKNDYGNITVRKGAEVLTSESTLHYEDVITVEVYSDDDDVGVEVIGLNQVTIQDDMYQVTGDVEVKSVKKEISSDSAYPNLQFVAYNDEDKTVTVKANPNNKPTGEYQIPNKVKKGDVIYSVTSIDAAGFENCTGLTSITIPKGLTSMGTNAFSGCTNLKKVVTSSISNWLKITFANAAANPLTTAHRLFVGSIEISNLRIPETVTAINNYAFSGCSGLNSVAFMEGSELVTIGDSAFKGCSSLASIEVPEGVTTIGQNAFNGCSNMEIFTFAENSPLESIGEGAFYGCKKLASIEIPEGVTVIDQNTFNGCEKLKTLTFAEDSQITTIAESAFKGCKLLLNIVIPSGVTSIGKDTFNGCSELVNLRFADGSQVTSIGEGAFNGCAKLMSLTIPAEVTSIGKDAFKNCSTLESVTLSQNSKLANVGEDAFLNCNNLNNGKVTIFNPKDWLTVSFANLYANPLSYAHKLYLGENELTSLEIVPEITTIGSFTFANCTSLTSVRLADNSQLTTIGTSAFTGCSNLINVSLAKSETITTVGASAFAGCENLEQVTISTIPNWLRISFGDQRANPLYYANRMFSGSTGEEITELNIQNGTTEIKDYAFINCTSLTRITVPDTLTSLGEDAFLGCSNVVGNTDDYAVYIGNTTTLYLILLRAKNTELDTCNISSQCKFIHSSAFAGCAELTRIVVPTTVIGIGNSAFTGCSSLQEITLPFIGRKSNESRQKSSVFGYVFGTKAYTGGKSISQRYNETTVSNSTSYQTATYVIPESLTAVTINGTSVPYGAFYGCTMLEDVTISRTVQSIGEYAFSGCSSIDTVTFATNNPQLLTVGYYAFAGCKALTEIELPATITSMGSGVFSNCTALVNITIPFVGSSVSATSASATTLFGYIFGESSYTGGTAVRQWFTDHEYNYYYNSYSRQYYIPSTLREVIVLGGNVLYGAFDHCTMLTKITLPSTLTSVGAYSFYGCSELVTLNVSENLTSIGSNAFASCTKLSGNEYDNAIYLGNEDNEHLILYKAKNKDITSCTIHEDCKFIYDSAFSACRALTEIVIPSGVTQIRTSAFQDCTSLTKLTIKEGDITISGSAFTNCYELFEIYNLSNLSLTIGSSDNGEVARYAKDIYDSLSTPSKITELGDVLYYQIDGDSTNLIALALKDKTKTDITLNANTKKINQYAFYKTAIENISIPSTLTHLGYSAFADCNNLEYTEYQGAKYIGNNTNNYLILVKASSTSITTATINSNCKFIHSLAFNDCQALEELTFEENSQLATICENAFQNCKLLTSIDIPSSVTTIESSAFYGCSKLESMTLPFVGRYASSTSADKTTVFGYIFGTQSYTGGTGIYQYYESSKNVYYYIPSTLRTITLTGGKVLYGAFYGCSMLTTINFPSTLTSIGTSAFYGCSKLESITIPAAVATINSSAFYGCSGLTAVTFEDNSQLTAIVSSLFSSCTKLESVTFGENGHLATIGNSAFQGCSKLESITIPSTVTTLGGSAFYGCTSLTTVIFEENINLATIGSQVFYGCTSLSEITIPTSVKIIESSVFSGCTSLSEITIPTSVTTIGSSAFQGCTSLSEVTIPASVTNLSSSVFYGCTSLTTITFADGSQLTSIPSSVFYGCTSLTTINFPSNSKFTTISSSAFYNCTSLTSLQLPSSVKYIESSAYSGCTGLVTVVVPNTVETIGSGAFARCTNLQSITLPFVGNKVEPYRPTSYSYSYQYPLGYIFGTSSYQGGQEVEQKYYRRYSSSYSPSNDSIQTTKYYIPSSLRQVTITGGLILYGAFNNCSMLTNITVPSNITIIYETAFQGCSNLTTFTVPSTVTTIGISAFKDCSELVTLQVPSTVTSIGKDALFGCTKLTGELYKGAYYLGNSSNAYFVLYKVADKQTNQCEIHADCKFIYDSAFENCPNIVTVDMGLNVVNIGYKAFANCTSLARIVLSTSVKSIAENAFDGCYVLVEVFNQSSLALTKGATTHGKVAYYALDVYNSSTISDNTKLETIDGVVYYKQSATSYMAVTLADKTKTSINLDSRTTSIYQYAFYNCTNLTNITIPSGITNIGDNAFEGCTNISWASDGKANYLGNAQNPYVLLYKAVDTNITNCEINSNCKFIHSSAFADCSNLTSITIPNGVQEIGDLAFSGCNRLTSVVVPNSVQRIGTGAFAGCTALESITLPYVGGEVKAVTDKYQYPFGYIFGTSEYEGGTAVEQNFHQNSLTEFGSTTYYIPSSLRNVTITGGLILDGAFYGCNMLTNVTVPTGITKIGKFAFNGCSNLAAISIPATVTEISESAFKDCAALTSVTFANQSQLTALKDEAFAGCNSLQTLILPTTITTIGENVLSGCSSLAELRVPFVGAKLTTQNSDSKYPIGYIFGAEEYEGSTAVSQKYYGANNALSTTTYYIPASLRSVTVTSGAINYGAFYGCSMLTSISLPSSLTSIDSYAFYNCSEITEMNIPPITNLGSGVFDGCTKLTGRPDPDNSNIIYLGTSFSPYHILYKVTNTAITSGTVNPNCRFIYDSAFANCTQLTSITIPSNVKSIGIGAFKNCTSLATITFADESNLTKIDDNAFEGCSTFTQITLPAALSTIGQEAFKDCTSLTSVTIPSNSALVSGVSIKENAFINCYSLVEITNLAQSLSLTPHTTSNGYIAYYAKYIRTVSTQQSRLTTIDDVIYYVDGSNYTVLTLANKAKSSLELHENTVAINSYAFANCTSLSRISIPSTVTSVGDNAFLGCTNLSGTVQNNAIYLGNATDKYIVLLKAANTNITSCTVESTCKFIHNGAFSGCNSLTSITLPFVGGENKTKTDNDQYPFGYIFGEVEYEGSVEVSQQYYGPGLTDIDLRTVKYYVPSSLRTVVITGGNILRGAFQNCSMLTNITIPNTTSIEQRAFDGCTALSNITIPSTVTSIGEFAFNNCSSLTNVTIPNNVASIGNGIFAGCTSLTTLTLPFVGGSVKTTTQTNQFPFGYIFGTNDISGTTAVAQTYYASSTTSTINATYYVPSSLRTVTITGGNILRGAFGNCSMLTSITLPSTLTSIELSAFEGCSGLTSITIPSSVTSISRNAFKDCTALSSVTFAMTSGWSVYDTATATSGTAVGALTNATNNATMLTTTYVGKYWKRNV